MIPGMWEMAAVLVAILILWPSRWWGTARALGECLGLLRHLGQGDDDGSRST